MNTTKLPFPCLVDTPARLYDKYRALNHTINIYISKGELLWLKKERADFGRKSNVLAVT